ncbi:TetR family transcriptional regulator [Halorubrum sp. CBA1125]|uniref:TetR/AcrR family transcriptional regulator n=1 Tax=Halorubrum sp. CBA1125 TaxID=2668072 RepID=UPI00135D5F31|nr:helix-turn-helix domain-containing protein [Halorubrum sp. CBA1125]MUW14949.1 TetR family transcriptional regulator [Halorubrum sp. CBA1125]
MTRFTDEDRERIRAELIEAGHELFAEFGFDRTRVSDVTDAVGIGTSTFYQFFDSKEALYLEVLLVERDRIFERLEAELAGAETAREEAETILRTMFSQVRSSPLTSRLFVEGEIRLVEAQLDGTEHETADPGEIGKMLPQPDEWVARDDVSLDDPDVVRGVLRSLLFVTQAQGTPLLPTVAYEAVEDALIETVVDGLFADG